MSKLNRILAGAAVAGSLAAWSGSQAIASMTYSIVQDSGTPGQISVGTPVTLSLFATISPGAVPNGFFLGSGSFLNTVLSGDAVGSVTGVTLPNAAFSGAGNASVVGVSANINADGITDWGSTNGPTSVNDAGFFIIRPNGDPAPLATDLSSGTVELAREVINLTAGTTGSASFSFQLRNRGGGLVDQLWAENYTTTTTVDSSGVTHLASVTNTKSEETGGTVSFGSGVVLSIAASGTPNLWTGNGADTNWLTPGNWDNGIAPSAATVSFGKNATNVTVTVPTAVTTAGLAFTGTGSFNITGAGTINVGASGISLLGTSLAQSVKAPVTFTQTAAIIDNGTTNSLALGAVTLSGGKTLTVSASTHVQMDTLNNAGPLAGSAGSLSVAGNLKLTAITGRTASAPTNLTVLDGLSVSGLFDVTNHDMLIHNATYSTILSLVTTAYGTGSWNGTTGITSSSAASAGNTGLAVVNGIDYAGLVGSALFDGYTVATTDVVIKYTYLGDANLDGTVTFADFGKFQPNYNQPGVFGWKDGDWNYDGTVTFADFGKFQPNYNSGAPVLAGGFVAVPEPASIALLGMAGASLLVRRRGVRR